MMNLLLFADAAVNMNQAFSKEAMDTFYEGLKVLGIGMSTVIGILAIFYLLIKLLIKIFPEKE